METGVNLSGGWAVDEDGSLLVGQLNADEEVVLLRDRRDVEREMNFNVGGRCGGGEETTMRGSFLKCSFSVTFRQEEREREGWVRVSMVTVPLAWATSCRAG